MFNIRHAWSVVLFLEFTPGVGYHHVELCVQKFQMVFGIDQFAEKIRSMIKLGSFAVTVHGFLAVADRGGDVLQGTIFAFHIFHWLSPF
jgi:hypothetical protein